MTTRGVRRRLRFARARFALAACALLPFVPPAAGQTGATGSDSAAAPTLIHPSAGMEVKRPSPGTAAILSHAGLVFPIVASTLIRSENSEERTDLQIATVGIGVAIGPALGYWYGDLASRGSRGALGRLACVAAVFGTLSTVRYLEDSVLGADDLSLMLIGAGAAGAAGSWALWDAANVAPRVEARNREARAVSWDVVPALSPGSGASAVAIAARF